MLNEERSGQVVEEEVLWPKQWKVMKAEQGNGNTELSSVQILDKTGQVVNMYQTIEVPLHKAWEKGRNKCYDENYVGAKELRNEAWKKLRKIY